MSKIVLKIKQLDKIQTEFGTAKIDNGRYYRITTRKEGNHRKNLHRLIFERFYGPIPEDFDVHHKDGNKLNNCLINLQLMSKFKHLSHHNKGQNNPRYNSCIKIRKRKSNSCKQGFSWVAQPNVDGKQIVLQSVDKNECIKKVINFINSDENTYGYETYEVKE